MMACATEKGICLLEFNDRPDLTKQISSLQHLLGAEVSEGNNEFLDQLEIQMDRYFNNSNTIFTLPLHLAGTDFQKRVWNRLLSIPSGITVTYNELTTSLGDKKALRAVASANGANKIAIIVPCHRVIGSDGNLTGYAGGLGRKRWLLDHESAQTSLGFNH